jgi:hypothetical protein
VAAERQRAEPPSISTSSSDDLGLLLSQPTPDPYLQESSTDTPQGLGPEDLASPPRPELGPESAKKLAGEAREVLGTGRPSMQDHDIGLDIRISSDDGTQQEFPPAVVATGSGTSDSEHEPTRISWPFVFVASYASALTLAVVWILVTGRSLSRPTVQAEAPTTSPLAARRSEASPSRSIPLPDNKLVRLGSPARLGDLEVTPRAVTYAPVELVRLAEEDSRREADPALILTLEIKNHSSGYSFAPLDGPLVRDVSPGDDQPCLELPGGRRIALFRLAPESEWSILGQDFPTLGPGGSGQTTLVTEPLSLRDLSDPLIWRVKLRISPFQTDVLGVRFKRPDIQDLTQ